MRHSEITFHLPAELFRTAAILCALSPAFAFTAQLHAAPNTGKGTTAPPTPAQCGIPGHHALLERMTAAFKLTCDQERRIEPLLHDEESVSKPLIAFAAFTPEEKKAVMQRVKVAARKQILPLLTPEQQAKMQQEIETVSEGGEGLQKGNRSGRGRKMETAAVDPYRAEESLSQAIAKYSAFSNDEKRALIKEVKKASIRSGAPRMAPDQVKLVAAELKRLSA